MLWYSHQFQYRTIDLLELSEKQKCFLRSIEKLYKNWATEPVSTSPCISFGPLWKNESVAPFLDIPTIPASPSLIIIKIKSLRILINW